MNKLNVFKTRKQEAIEIGYISDSMERHTALAYLYTRCKNNGFSESICDWFYDLAESIAWN